jgi:hypothetical protein
VLVLVNVQILLQHAKPQPMLTDLSVLVQLDTLGMLPVPHVLTMMSVLILLLLPPVMQHRVGAVPMSQVRMVANVVLDGRSTRSKTFAMTLTNVLLKPTTV